MNGWPMTDPACNGRDRSKASAAEPNVPRARVRAAYPSSYSASLLLLRAGILESTR